MIIIHIESGLGNQMLTYLEYLAIKQTHQNEKIFFESIVYEIDEACKTINMWNGYELDKVFNINVPNIKELFSLDEWNLIIKEVKNTKFWKSNWSWDKGIYSVLKKHGLEIEKNFCYSQGLPNKGKKEKWFKKVLNGYPYAYFVRYRDLYRYKSTYKLDHSSDLFYSKENNFYCGHTLKFKNINYGIEKLVDDINESFKFDKLDDKNIEFGNRLEQLNAVAIHARRGDMLNFNGVYYKNGYFKRALNIIKKNTTKELVYVFFSDTGSIEWCKDNLKKFGINKNDTVLFVDWNKGMEAYKDMYLISKCKYNIITCSTFGWWGSFFNNHFDKITVSPYSLANTTHHA